MNSEDSKEITMDSIDVTIFEDFYTLDITLPFIADPAPLPEEAISSSSSSIELPLNNEAPLPLTPDMDDTLILEEESSSMPSVDLDVTLPVTIDTSNIGTSVDLVDISLPLNTNPVPSPSKSIPSSEKLLLPVDEFKPPLVPELEKDFEQTFSVFSSNISNLRLNNADPDPEKSILLTEELLLPEDEFKIPLAPQPEKDFEQTFSVFSANLRTKTPSKSVQPMIVFSPAVVPQTRKSVAADLLFSPVHETPENGDPSIIELATKIPKNLIEMDETSPLEEETLTRTSQSPLNLVAHLRCSPVHKLPEYEDPEIAECISERQETPTDMDKTLLFEEIPVDPVNPVNSFDPAVDNIPDILDTPNIGATIDLADISLSLNADSVATPEKSILSSEELPLLTEEFKLPLAPQPEKDFEQTFSVFSSNLSNLRLNKTPSRFKQPLIIFSPAVVPQTPKSVYNAPIFSSVNESSENEDPQIMEFTPKRAETPTDMDKTLVLKQISARTNQSPLYTPVTAMVSRFRNLALESPYPLSNINNKPKSETPKTVKETLSLQKSGQHKTVEKVKLISPLLKSPKFRPVSTRLPSRGTTKICKSNEKKSPTIAQYKANPPVNQGSRIPVLKLI